MGRVAKLFAALALVAAAAGAQPTPIIPHIHHATDCTAATANRGTQCWEEDSARLFTCVPTVGTCDTAGEWILALTTLAGDVDGSSGANDLDEAAVEAELEAVQDLQDFQGAVTDGQVPDNITLALESASLTAILDDEVLVGTGAAAGAYTALQNCNDTTGKLDWTGSAFACVTDATGALVVEEADGSPSVATVDTIEFDSADGFTVTDETGGDVQVDLLFSKLLDLDGDGVDAIGGTSGTDITLDPDDDNVTEFTITADTIARSETNTAFTLSVPGSTGSIRLSTVSAFFLVGTSGGSAGITPTNTNSGMFAAANGSSTVPVFRNRDDVDTGLGWNGSSNDGRLIAGGASTLGFTDTEVDLYLIRDDDTQSETCASTGTGALGALTITPAKSYVEITNSDVDGCDITISETGAAVGRVVDFTVISNAGGTVNFADTAGVTELAGAFNAAIDDYISLRYGTTTTWRERFRSNN
jgi:hypothetical protein